MDDRTDRNVLERQAVAWLDVCSLRRNDLVTNRQTLWRDDVGEIAALIILDERDECGPVWIVFETLDSRALVPAVTLEVDLAIETLCAATDTANGDTATVVTAT